jgi:hypothetical protein
MNTSTNHPSLLTFNFIIYTKAQQSTMLPFLIFYSVNRFRKFLSLFLLIFHYNNVKASQNRLCDLTVISTQMKAQVNNTL